MVVRHLNRITVPCLLVFSVVLAVSCSCFAQDSTDAAATAVLEELDQTTATLPGEWYELGQLLMAIIDQRSELSLTIKSDAIIRKYVEEALTDLKQKMTDSDAKLEDLNNQVKTFVDELRNLLLAHDQQLNDMEIKIATFTDQSSKDFASRTSQLQLQVDEQAKQIAKLQTENAGLHKRFWISTSMAALGIILAIALK